MNKNPAWTIILGITAFSLIYSITRYHLFKGVSWQHFPLYILNKSISFTAILLLAISFLSRYFQAFSRSRTNHWGVILGSMALGLVIIHFLISALLMRETTFPLLFTSNALNVRGEVGLLFGILAFISLLGIAIVHFLKKTNRSPKIEKTFFQFLKCSSLALTASHVLIIGYSNWIKPKEWPGYLVPISLISFIIIVLILIIRFRSFYKK